MPIIGKVGRKSAKVRILNSSIHLVLILGAITMIYPFMMMITASFSSSVDSNNYSVYPKFFFDDSILYKKYIASKYNEESTTLVEQFKSEYFSFRDVNVTEDLPGYKDLWEEFLHNSSENSYDYFIAEQYSRGLYPKNERAFRSLVKKKSKSDLDILNEKYDTEIIYWEQVQLREEKILLRSFTIESNKLTDEYQDFKKGLAYSERVYPSVDGHFLQNTVIQEVGSDISKINEALEKDYHSLNEFVLPRRKPEGNLAEYWDYYCKNLVNISQLAIDESQTPKYQEMLKEKYADSIDLLNKTYKSSYASFEEINFPNKYDIRGARKIDYQFFIETIVDSNYLYLDTVEWRYRDYLASKFKNIDEYNDKFASNFESFNDVTVNYQALSYGYFLQNKSEIFWEMVKRNYIKVLDTMLLSGRAVYNTIFYVLLAIITALIVNPLAAYAMSRFKLRATYKILLFLMLTMAFPPMVMGIPNFLLLKKFSLLNTFWALILPAMADGYFIFLLKGFFDSLPKELFESATIDGAGEVRVFWNIAMQLSKPIMAVIALNAFNAAYRNFMFAFIVCQDRNMWTMMVHIYQLMQRSSLGVGYAALVIASIPTLLVFIFFQNIIIRGIVVPTEK